MITNKAVLKPWTVCTCEGSCSVLAEEAIAAALQDYRVRNGMETDYVGCGGCCGGCNRVSHHDENGEA